MTEKGIDVSRVSIAIGTTDAQKVENYLVPSGAITQFDRRISEHHQEGELTVRFEAIQ